MGIKTTLLTCWLTVTTPCVIAQALPVDRNTQHAINAHTRSTDGAPGKAYWQNQANYNIAVTFDPASRKVAGSVQITYRNNSPDTLKRVLLKLFPNLYKTDAPRNTVIAQADLGAGVHISHLEVSGKTIDSAARIAAGTNLPLNGMHIAPHTTTEIKIAFDYILNRGSFTRTGQIDTGTAFIAYFFPRVAVYDDVDGWNAFPYIGKEEFYNDYGDFDVTVQVPGNYCVWATGELQNTAQVYAPKIANRILLAEQSDTVINVINAADLKAGDITSGKAFNTWHFTASQVTDFAFAVSKNYIWKAASILVDPVSKRRTRVDAVFLPAHRSYEPVVQYNRRTVELISCQFPKLPFPYSHMTIVDGLDAMEYPMMVNNLPFEDPSDIIAFTSHEVFHSIFPFYVGTNESKYSFMDEGWATMTEFMFHPFIDSAVALQYDLSAVNDYAGLQEDVPVITPTPQLYGKARYADKDLKPALATWYLKGFLGDTLFTKAVQYYIHTWAGRHPTPYDFFNAINRATGKDLNWFWKKWYLEKAVPDLGITMVTRTNNVLQITITNHGGAPVPVHLAIQRPNAPVQYITRSVGVWQVGASAVTIQLPASTWPAKITLGDALDADVHPADNVWTRPGS